VVIKKIKDFFTEGVSSGPGDREERAKKRIEVAACALLVEVAGMDDTFSIEEKGRIISLLKKEFSLSPEMAAELIELAELELRASTDLWQFTNLINESFTPEDKLRLMEMIWKIVYADGRLDKHEDYLAKKLARLLNLRRSEMIDAKLRVLGRKP